MSTDEEQEGRCCRSLLALLRRDAWRCIVSNQIFDPCFAPEEGEVIACGANPVTGECGFKVSLSERLSDPRVPAEATNKGRLIGLADGTLYSLIMGATLAFEEKRVNYECLDGSSIVGDSQAGSIWTK